MISRFLRLLPIVLLIFGLLVSFAAAQENQAADTEQPAVEEAAKATDTPAEQTADEESVPAEAPDEAASAEEDATAKQTAEPMQQAESVAVPEVEVAGTPVFDLESAVEKALSDNPLMEAARAGFDAANAGRMSARGDFLPSFSAGYSYTRKNKEIPTRGQTKDNYSMYFNIHQDIFTGFRTLNSYQKAAYERDKAEAELTDAELSMILNVQSNFLALLKAREALRSAQDSVKRLDSQLKVTRAFFDVGLKPRLDVLQAEVDMADAEDLLLQAENTVATQEVRLNTLLMLPVQLPVEYVGELEYTPFGLSFEQCLNQARKNRPDLFISRKKVEIAEKAAGVAMSPLYPQLGADFDWYSSGDDPKAAGSEYSSTNFSYWQVGLNANWKIFDWGSSWYGWRQAEHGVRAAKAEEMNQINEVYYDVKSKRLKIDEAAKRIKVARKALEQAREGYRMAEARYQAQVGTNTDVLTAQERLTGAEASLIQALADYQLALANMYVAIGEPNPSLLNY